MSPKRYQNAPTVSLPDYIETKLFRTVPHEQYEQPCGITEFPVELVMGEKFTKSLDFPTPWDRCMYGFVRENCKLREINGAAPYDRDDIQRSITVISLHDWDKQFLMTIGTKEGELAFFVASEEVKSLLEGCRRPPEQRNDM